MKDIHTEIEYMFRYINRKGWKKPKLTRPKNSLWNPPKNATGKTN